MSGGFPYYGTGIGKNGNCFKSKIVAGAQAVLTIAWGFLKRQ